MCDFFLSNFMFHLTTLDCNIGFTNMVYNVVFVHYSCGSINVDYELIFATVDPPGPQQLAQMLQQSLEDNGGLVSDDGTVFQVDETSIVFEGI